MAQLCSRCRTADDQECCGASRPPPWSSCRSPSPRRPMQRRPSPLAPAVDRLLAGTDSREGYQRTSFKHWNAGTNPTDGCNTRAEVLISEAVDAPEIGPGCRLTGDRWWSNCGATWVTSAPGPDVEHMVSGVSARTPQRREACANGQDADTSLVAVTARSNRSKSDPDPAQSLPPAPRRCGALSVHRGVGGYEAALERGRRRYRTRGPAGPCARLSAPVRDVRAGRTAPCQCGQSATSAYSNPPGREVTVTVGCPDPCALVAAKNAESGLGAHCLGSRASRN